MAEASVIMAVGTLIVAVLAFPAATRASRLVTAWLVAIVTIGMAAPFALGGLGPDGSGCSSPGPSESVREGSPAISPDRGVSSSWWPGGPATSPFRSTSSSWWPGGPATNPDCGVSDWWQLLVVLVAIIGGLLLLWLTLIVALWIIQLTGPDELREALKLLPDLGHLLQRLAADAAVPQRVRIGLAVLISYMLLPIDLVPDFIPVLGYTEDVVIVALALRWVVRCAETNLLSQHWRGTPERRTAYAQFSGFPVCLCSRCLPVLIGRPSAVCQLTPCAAATSATAPLEPGDPASYM